MKKVIDKKKKINDILIRFYNDEVYSRERALDDILKIINEDSTDPSEISDFGRCKCIITTTRYKKAFLRLSLNELPVPKDSIGYTKEEILMICRDRGIHHKVFNKAFGVNTVGVAKDGSLRYYPCDVEAALYSLHKPGGKFHLWD